MSPTPQIPTTPQPSYVEEPTAYLFTQVLTSGQHLGNLSVNIDRDADFLLTGIVGGSTGTYTLNFTLPSKRQYANAEIPNTLLIGTANQPSAIGPPPVYRAGSTGPQVTLTDTSAAGNTVNILFVGIRRVRSA